MTKGVPTPEDILAQFRAEYLISGNASECARKVGMSESAGRSYAVELNADVSFGEERRSLRAQYLDECVHARMRIMRKAEERAMAEDANVYSDANGGITVVDKRKDWADVVLAAEKNAHNLAKIEQGNEPNVQNGGTALVIKLASG
jgi:phage terminase small subunit